MPTLMVLACARATHGLANVATLAPISARVERRLMPGVRVLFIIHLPVGFAFPKSLAEIVPSPCLTRFQSKGGDVKPKMNYES